jgi:KaiC/GvpD/RAD55 family RecA-like ATPase
VNREHRVLSALLSSREAYNSIASVRDEADFSEQGWLLVQEVDGFYDADNEATSIDVDVIKDIICRTYPKSAGIINSLIDNLEPVSVPNVIADYIDLKKESLEHQIADAMLAGNEYEDLIEKLMGIAVVEEEQESTVFVNYDLDNLLEDLSPDNLIRFHPLCLNEEFKGGLVPGNQVAIYAPTEVGKSMLAINALCGFLKDGHTVLYGGNEDPAKSMLLRIYTCLTGMTEEEIRLDPYTARTIANENGYNNLIFKDLQPGSLREIRVLVERYSPQVVFVDQMANMECRSSNKVEKNEILAAGLRALAKRFDFVSVIVHQASDSAYGNNILQKNDMYFSNVGVQGMMDVMIGIGMDASYEQQDLRMLCLTKNKRGGTHPAIPVKVNTQISCVVDD